MGERRRHKSLVPRAVRELELSRTKVSQRREDCNSPNLRALGCVKTLSIFIFLKKTLKRDNPSKPPLPPPYSSVAVVSICPDPSSSSPPSLPFVFASCLKLSVSSSAFAASSSSRTTLQSVVPSSRLHFVHRRREDRAVHICVSCRAIRVNPSQPSCPPLLSRAHILAKLTNRKYVPDPSHVVDYEPLEIDENLSYAEQPVEVLAREVKTLRNKEIPLVKVLWRNHRVEEATWEREDDMRSRYLELFEE
ncbi:pol protein [Cucumis melo var. makuwa]|uniref:Pol protein n=1 Tax=Cucumis melo var. makuwa TaxID=1194695 RepID=A0A5A7SYQ7_CUCMM|nr:pol protein [Cucumis melo var. makuwa]